MMLALYALIPTITGILGVAGGYLAHMFIARNERHLEAVEFRVALHDARERTDKVKQERDDAYDEYDKLDRSYKQLEANHRATAAAYAQCESDLMVTDSRLRATADELLAYGVDVRADWAEQEADTADDEHVEAQPSMFFDDLTAEYRQHKPHLAGNTETWMMPSPDIDKAIADPYQRWNGFLPQLAAVPAQRDGGE